MTIAPTGARHGRSSLAMPLTCGTPVFGRGPWRKAWKPATFDHARYFRLDRDHAVACATCHVGNDYARYTCYGCHEHTPARVRAEHAEEGITAFEHCVECHRSASEADERGERD